jgi:hypothetical protein
MSNLLSCEVNKRRGAFRDGSHYMKHRDGSGTYVPTAGRYVPRKDRDPNSKLPALTMDDIIKEHEEINKEHRQYLARPANYRNGVNTTQTGRRGPDLSWLFPMYSFFLFFWATRLLTQELSCDCGDHYSGYDDYYPEYDYDYDYENDYDAYNDMGYEEYEHYGCGSEDEEEDYSEDNRRSPSPDEHKPIIKQEDDKTTVRITDSAHLPTVEETNSDVKQEIKEEIHNGPFISHLTVPKLEKAEPSASSPLESAATGSGAGKRIPHSSEIGPDVKTEGKRVSGFRSLWNPQACVSEDLSQILRSHRSKPY